MRRSLLLLASAALVTIAGDPGIFAQTHEIPVLNSCIKEFIDPGMYNYLSFKNNCTQSLTVVFVAKDGSGAGGTMDLRPGASDSVGHLPGGIVPKIGTFELYVCQAGYVPVDENNKVVTQPKSSFQCQLKAR